MRIAIVTLPLHTNYGGILQAYALKTCLESMGHEVTVLDRIDKMPLPKWWKAPFVYAKRAVMRLFKGASAPAVFREIRYRRELPVRSANTSKFIDTYIDPRLVRWYSDLKEGEYDAYVVGSDQVWRPLYFGKVQDAFLAFAKDWDVVRVAYAASFGTDKLEYEYFQIEECAALLEKFDGVSVREDSGVTMCSEWFDCERAVQVLDPVMLLSREKYESLLTGVTEHPCQGGLLTYILDDCPEKKSVVDFFKRVSGLNVVSVPVEDKVVPPIENWISSFADAEFVVTDSFHGCVMAILFHKPFVAVGNSRRGVARIQSLLEMFGLDMRLVQGIDPEDDGEYYLAAPDWEAVDAVLAQERMKSEDFLRKSLNVR